MKILPALAALSWWAARERARGKNTKQILDEMRFDHGMRCMEVACEWRYTLTPTEECSGGWP